MNERERGRCKKLCGCRHGREHDPLWWRMEVKTHVGLLVGRYTTWTLLMGESSGLSFNVKNMLLPIHPWQHRRQSVDVIITRAAGGVSRRRSIRPSCPASIDIVHYIYSLKRVRCRRELWAILRATNCDGRWLTHGGGGGSSFADVAV